LVNFAKIVGMKQYIHYKGKKIHYSEEGTGHPVLLIHGYLETGDVWKDFAPLISEKFRVIAIDLPGHGNSDIFGESHSMEFLAEAICGLLDTLGIEKAFIAGHSLGGYVALAFVEKFPSRLSGYCLFHSHPFADSEDALKKREREIMIVKAGKKFLMYPENVQRMFADSNVERFTDQLERSKKNASGIPAEGIIAVLKGMMARPSRVMIMEEGLVPCLWILGSMDNYIPCDMMKEKVRLPVNAELLVLVNSGHLGFIEEKEKSAEALTDFILKAVLHSAP
jgi:pimeloyl-ACP methyl ester carboxylesterase